MKARFKITINDGYCTYEYPLNISGNNSIDMIAKKIFKEYGIEPPNGNIVRFDNTKNELIKELKQLVKKYKRL